MNIQTKKKIEELKEMIKKKIKLENIIKEKFVTPKKKESWLDKNHKYFTEKELNYLNYSYSPEIVEVKEIIESSLKSEIDKTEIDEAIIEEEENEKVISQEKETEQENSIVTPLSNNIDFLLDSTKIFKSFEEIKTPQDKINFLLNDKVLKALFFMTEGQAIKNEIDATLKYNLENVKVKYSQNIKIKNIRINEDLYKHFTEFCDKNKITIISALSCALEEFLEKYKELDKEN